MEDSSKYVHSPAHLAVLKEDHDALRRIVAGLPRLAKAGEVNDEAESLAAEKDADELSAVIDRRDVPGRETPLHLAVRLKDAASAEILMAAGADWSLQNENGWSALQEAVCTREESIALIIARHYQPLAWAKWCRRLPRIVATAARIRDFYMEISFHFESSVIPFIGRIAPSDTYRIWKRGANLRADMTMGGFDGFRIQRSDQTFLFLGEGYTLEDGSRSLSPGSLLVLSHKKKEVTNTLEGAGAQPSEAEVVHEVTMMAQTNMYRPGIDVTQAELIPRMNWRRQVSTEMVGPWKAKVYDMNNVSVSMKSRRVPGAMTDEEVLSANEDERTANGGQHDDIDDVLTAEERIQLDSAIRMGNSEDEGSEVQGSRENRAGTSSESYESNGITKEKKGWLGWSKRSAKHTGGAPNDSKTVKKSTNLAPENNKRSINVGDSRKNKDRSSKKKKTKGATGEPKIESEYKKGVKPVLWLTPDFPLKTEELLPLLDILASKVKAVRRLRELLTTKLPPGTFPVKIAIPIVPTIRVLVTFTKFEELQPIDDEFSTPLSSPQSSPTHFQDAKSKGSQGSTSWISWIRGGRGAQLSDGGGRGFRDEIDPFHIPSDYTWVDANEKKRRLKAKRAANRKHKKPGAPGNPESGHRVSENTVE